MVEHQVNKEENQNCPEFNGILTGLLVLMLISSIGHSLSKLVQSMIPGTSGTGLAVLMFVLEMVNVVFFIALLNRKAWGLWGFFGMMLLQIPLNLMLGNPRIGLVAFSAGIRIALISLLLLIPKKGVTAWRVLFPKKGPRQTSVPDGTSSSKKPIKIPTWAFYATGVVLAIVFLFLIWPRNHKADALKTDYFYMEVHQGYPHVTYHLNPTCKDGLVYREKEEVFRDGFVPELFCAKCISTDVLSAIRDSCQTYQKATR